MRSIKSTVRPLHSSVRSNMGLRVCLLLTLLCLPCISFAGDVEKTVTLDEAYRFALSSHEAINIANEGALQAEATVDKAFSQMLPKLNVEGSHTVYSEQKYSGAILTQPDDYSRLDVKISQSLYSGGKDSSARRQANIISSKSRAGQDAARDGVIRLTARAYYGLLKAVREMEIKVAALKRADERQKIAAARLKVGEVTRAALLRSEALLAGAQADLIRAQGDVKNARSFFVRITGISGDFQLVEPPNRVTTLQEADALIQTALEQRADYRQSVLDERAADENITYTKSGFLPSLRLEGAYAWREQHPKNYYQRESVSGALVASWPIFEGGLRYAELSEARSKHREAEQRRLALKRDIEVQVIEAVDRLESVSAALESYRKQLSFAEEDARMVAEQFKYGLATIVDVIDSDSALVNAQRSLMNATYDFELAKLELKAAVGRLGEEVLVRDAAHGM